MAKAEADASIIKLQNKIDLSRLADRAKLRLERENLIYQNNMEQILDKTISQLSEKSDASKLNNDWLINYFDKARLVSDEDMHLNLWVSHYFPKDSWKTEISQNRLGKVSGYYEERKEQNQELSLLDCLQFCDKKEILSKSNDFLNVFEFSKSSLRRFLKRAENIRNDLAHSQKSIISNMEWNKFYETLSSAETFLVKSDDEIEKMPRDSKDFNGSLI